MTALNPYKKRKRRREYAASLHVLGDGVMWGHGEKVVVCKPEREISPDTSPAGTLPWDFHLPQLRK